MCHNFYSALELLLENPSGRDVLSFLVLPLLAREERRCFAAVCRSSRALVNGSENRLQISLSPQCPLKSLGRRFPRLTSLTLVNESDRKPLDDKQLMDHLEDAAWLGRLLSLDIKQCSHLSVVAITPLLSVTSKLEHLSLNRWSCTASILAFPASLKASLRRLDLGDSRQEVDVESINDSALLVLSSSCWSLRKLSLSRCVTITDTGLASLSMLRNLEELSLAGCKGVSHLPHLPALQVLDASHCCQVGDSALQSMAQGRTPALKQLLLAHSAVTNVGLRVCSQMPHLQHLDLGPSFEANSMGLAALGRCASLYILAMGNLVIEHDVQGVGPWTPACPACPQARGPQRGSSGGAANSRAGMRGGSHPSGDAAMHAEAGLSCERGGGLCCVRGGGCWDGGRSSSSARACGCSTSMCGTGGSRSSGSSSGAAAPSISGLVCGATWGGSGSHVDPSAGAADRAQGTHVLEVAPVATSLSSSSSSSLAKSSLAGSRAPPASLPSMSGGSAGVGERGCPAVHAHALFMSLDTLQFGGAFFTCGLHKVFPIAPRLTTLCVKGYNTVVGPHIACIAKQRSLEHIQLHGGYTLGPQDCQPLTSLPRLKTLMFVCCPLITEAAATQLLHACSSCLTTIELQRHGSDDVQVIQRA